LAEKEYLIRLGEHARKRHHHKTDKGTLLTFTLQLEVEVEEGVWKPVIGTIAPTTSLIVIGTT
jgi:hypothetical protein